MDSRKSLPSGTQTSVCLPIGLGGLAPVFGGSGGLPKTSLGSFVASAQGSAELIYGDKGSNDIPPYNNLTAHRIIQGMQSENGLTTGHGSPLPSAWGLDEFIGAPEMSFSGSQGSGAPAVYRAGF